MHIVTISNWTSVHPDEKSSRWLLTIESIDYFKEVFVIPSIPGQSVNE